MVGCARHCDVCGHSNYLDSGTEQSFECSRCRTVNTLGKPASQDQINDYLRDRLDRIERAFKS